MLRYVLSEYSWEGPVGNGEAAMVRTVPESSDSVLQPQLRRSHPKAMISDPQPQKAYAL